MHFPLPMPAFDIACADVPYMGIATWQNRVFAVPPAMGIDYRVVNGYIYISGNPVTDPAKIAERAEFFQKRAGYYFANWDELYGKWKVKMEALIAELTELRVPELEEYEPDDVVFEDDRDTAASRCSRRTDGCCATAGSCGSTTASSCCSATAPTPRSSTSARAASRTSPISTSPKWLRASTCSCSGPTPSSSGWHV